MEITQTHHFSERKPDNNWKLHVPHDALYYQQQSDTYNQHQQYINDVRTKKLLPEMITKGKKWENMEIFIVE